MPEEPKTVANPTMPTAPVSVIPAAPTPMGPSNFLTFVPSSIKAFIVEFISLLHLFLMGLYSTLCSLLGLSLVKVALTSQFEVGSSSATIPDPVSKAFAFFALFN